MNIKSLSIINYPNYEIYDDGKVWSIKKNKYLKPTINGIGYKQVTLCNETSRSIWTIHQLVAIAFIGNYLYEMCVYHKDGDKLNNNVSNLEWRTKKHQTFFFNKSKKRESRKKIKCLETGQLFNSTIEVSKFLNRTPQAVRKAIKFNWSCRNYHFYWTYE